ncbi:MAG: cadherin-like domain-containing protein, partial [ANME-2 cluster archaeon]|nr:cadherin-like domain-containing protein [ANME-2 cluster archaeon]
MKCGMRQWMLAMIAVIFIITAVDIGMAEQIKITGDVTGDIWLKSPTDTPESRPISDMYVSIMDWDLESKNDLMKRVQTNSQGHYDTGWVETSGYDSFLDPEAEVYLFANLMGEHINVVAGPEIDHNYGDQRGEFTYDIDWDAGDAINVFYHATVAHKYFNSFGYEMIPVEISILDNLGSGYQGGVTFGSQTIHLQAGEYARMSDIIFHEYTHAVINNIYHDTLRISDPNEAALGEAIADYFAVSMNEGINDDGDSRMGGTSRDLSEHFDMELWNDTGDKYENSKILSSTLWDIRQELSHDITDRLIFETLIFSQPVSFEQMHYYMLLVDDDNENIHDGTLNGEIISNVFKGHGMDFISYSPEEPWFFEQFNSDGITEIPFGGITNERNVVLKASVDSLGIGSRSTVGVIEPDLQLEVEIKAVGTAFENNPSCISGPAVVPVNTAYVTCSDLPTGQYHWQARVKDVYGATGPWVSAGENLESDPDFIVTNNPPNQPTSLIQWDSVGATEIPLGGITDENTVLFDGVVSDPDNDDVQLEVEVRPLGTAFTDTPTCISDPAVASGSRASATCTGLADGQYHWQARARDSNDATGPWISAGGNAETSPDFEVRIGGRTGGPDHFGYIYKDSNSVGGPNYDWIDIASTGTKIITNCDDCYVNNIPVGFFFNYYGTDYSQLSITNNGLTLASGGTSQWTNQPIGSSSPHNFIAPFWDDIVTWDWIGADAIYYQTIGEAPNRKFVVQWNDNYHYSSSPSGITFEAILYEGTNNIIFQYQDVNFEVNSWDNGASATVGIESANGQGLQYSYNERVINPGLAIQFKYPQFAGTNMYLSKQAPASKDHGSSMTYNLYYHNFGDTQAQNVVLEDTLPEELEFISASNGGTYDPITRKVIWNIGTVAPLGHDYRTVTVRIDDNTAVETVIQNNARIDTSTLEVRYDDNDANAQTRVTGSTLPPDVSVEPNNGGTTPSVYWQNPITYSYNSCDTATGVDIRIHINDGGSDITGSMTGGPTEWTYTAAPFYPRHGTATITYTIYGCSQSTVSFNIYIDPAGYIYDIITGDRIAGATVWLQWSDGAGDWVNVPTNVLPNAIMQPDTNPQITGVDGMYQWDVLEGSYRVHVESDGYYPADSIVVSIPPPVFDLHVGLTRIPSANQPPVAEDDTSNTDEDTGITIDVADNDNDVDGNLDPSTTTVISDPSQGTLVNNGDGTIAYNPNENYFGIDSFTYEICDIDGECDSALVTIDINPVNDPPVISVDIDSQTVQYSDGITPITVSVTDIDSSSLSLSTSWTKDGGSSQPNLPADLSQNPESCEIDGASVTCTWILEGQAQVDAGNYELTFIVTDEVDNSEEYTTIIVEPEDAACALNSENSVAIQVASPGGISGAFSLKVDVTEALPDNILDVLQTPLPGDISFSEVSMSLVPVGPGPSVSPISTCTGNVDGTEYDATKIITCEFDEVEVNTYSVQVTVDGGYYTGSGEDVLVIYDPSLGFTTGGGHFLWPETGEKTNFGYTMKYNKKGTNIQGNLLLVRHLPDGTIYRVKSNALYGLAL